MYGPLQGIRQGMCASAQASLALRHVRTLRVEPGVVADFPGLGVGVGLTEGARTCAQQQVRQVQKAQRIHQQLHCK
jgi:hypothetical protein